jgi:predicted transcriptional regulator
MKKKTNNICFRCSDDFKSALSLISQRETRSVSMQVEHYVRAGMALYLERNSEDADIIRRAMEDT